MPDPRPADSWKLTRLILLLGVMLGVLAIGSYARLSSGVPEHRRWRHKPTVANLEKAIEKMMRESASPFDRLRYQFHQRGYGWNRDEPSPDGKEPASNTR
jgi:hypothetical protein